MSLTYVIRRILLFFVVVWAATTFIFFLPKLAPGRNPIVERIGMMAATGGVQAGGLKEMVEAYEKKFGLDKPLWQQYLTYMADMSHLDFGYSLMLYPTRVLTVVLIAMPWTIGLLSVATLIAFTSRHDPRRPAGLAALAARHPLSCCRHCLPFPSSLLPLWPDPGVRPGLPAAHLSR